MLHDDLNLNLLEGYTRKIFKSRDDFILTTAKILVSEYLNLSNPNKWEFENLDDLLDGISEGKVNSEWITRTTFYECPSSVKSIQHLTYSDLGDGNEAEDIYTIFDESNKEYYFICFSGTYSSWVDTEWYEPDEIYFEEVTAYRSMNVEYK